MSRRHLLVAACGVLVLLSVVRRGASAGTGTTTTAAHCDAVAAARSPLCRDRRSRGFGTRDYRSPTTPRLLGDGKAGTGQTECSAQHRPFPLLVLGVCRPDADTARYDSIRRGR